MMLFRLVVCKNVEQGIRKERQGNSENVGQGSKKK
jgi:hypothetical protein